MNVSLPRPPTVDRSTKPSRGRSDEGEMPSINRMCSFVKRYTVCHVHHCPCRPDVSSSSHSASPRPRLPVALPRTTTRNQTGNTVRNCKPCMSNLIQKLSPVALPRQSTEPLASRELEYFDPSFGQDSRRPSTGQRPSPYRPPSGATADSGVSYVVIDNQSTKVP